MANLPISQLPSASIATGSNVLPIVQGGVTDQITVTNLGNGIFRLNLPLTASGLLIGGNIIPAVSKSFSLGSTAFPFRDIYISSGSLVIASDNPGDPSTTLSNTNGNILVSAGGMQLLGSGSFNAATGSFQYITGSVTHIGNDVFSGSVSISGSGTLNGFPILTSAVTGALQADWTATSGSSKILNVIGSNGPTNVSIGKNVGQFTPPSYSVAIGSQAGQSNQGEYGVAIGNSAGQLFQGTNAVAIGSAGYEDQGQYAIAIGSGAGDSGQGAYAIAIGAGAGANHQTAGSIIIDATNTVQSAAGAGFHVAPIRTIPSASNLLTYNTSTKEIQYATSFTGSLQGTASYAINHAVITSSYVCEGILSANQTFATGSDATIAFVDYADPNNWLASNQFKPTIAGYYSVSFGVWLQNPGIATNQVNTQMRKNGNSIIINQQPLNNGTGIGLGGSRIVQMNGTTDYLDWTIFQGTAGSGTTGTILQGSANGQGTWFSAFLITQ